MAKKRKASKATASTAVADPEDDEEDQTDATDADDGEADDSVSDDLGDPTENVTPGENTSPDGQTASGSAELGPAADDADFDDPVTNLDPLGTKQDTRVRKSDSEDSGTMPKMFSSLAKALGHKKSDILGFNEGTQVLVLKNGGKYQFSRNKKSLRHLAGPKPPADLDLSVVDARSRSPFVGTAAAINASVHTDPQSALTARRERLARELAAVDAQLEE